MATPLTSTKWYPITLEFFENSGGSVITLSYSSASTPKQIIPHTNLSPDGINPGGLKYECFDNTTLSGSPTSVGIDETINFNPADEVLGVNRANGSDTFSCRWTGYLKVDHDEKYTFLPIQMTESGFGLIQI